MYIVTSPCMHGSWQELLYVSILHATVVCDMFPVMYWSTDYFCTGLASASLACLALYLLTWYNVRHCSAEKWNCASGIDEASNHGLL